MSPLPGAVLLSPVLTMRLREGILTGLVGGAATAGAVVGFGLRHGTALLPFEMAGRALAVVGSAHLPRPLLLLAGLVAHALWALLVGVAFTLARGARTGGRAVLAVLAVALAHGVLAMTIVPGLLGAGAYAVLGVPQLVALVAVQTVACAIAKRGQPQY